MGLLSLGHPLDWFETKPIADYIKEHGIIQFINLYHRLKDRQGDCLKWGDEIEYQMVKFDHANKRAYVSLRGTEILAKLMAEESSDPTKNEFLWRPEYAEYMLEGTPGMPYGGFLPCFNVVEDNMKRRRAKAAALLNSDETIFSIPCFPRLGCSDFTRPPTRPHSSEGYSHSLFFPDEAVYSAHPRFKNLTRNIRQRRGEKVVINVPIFKDVNTTSPFREDFSKLFDLDGQGRRNSKEDHIYMDAMGFGMGCCCLQVTFQAVNINEARWLYDQLTPITPVVLALSAATPIFRGYLADVDSRWNIISAAVDDRTEEERGLKPLKENKFRIPRSRYDVTDCYLYACSAGYNDIPLEYEQKHFDKLVEGGVDELLARHIAHLFIRDPLQVFKERVEQNDLESSEHFETIQSSNWRNMRFKPPPVDSPSIGWRVEFRPTEVQLTDFENAAYVCFVVLLTRVIISFRLTFLIPISKVNENMERAQKRDAVLNQKFYFRRVLATCDSPPDAVKVFACAESPASANGVANGNSASPHAKPPSDDYIEMTINEIVNGKPPDFPGLIPLMQIYLDSADVDVDTRCTIQQYLRFIKQRASGQLWTLAHWIREFVKRHPDYKQDSVVSEEMNYDLLKTMDDIAQGRAHCPCLLGTFRTKAQIGIPDAVDKAEIMYRNYAVGRSQLLNEIHQIDPNAQADPGRPGSPSKNVEEIYKNAEMCPIFISNDLGCKK